MQCMHCMNTFTEQAKHCPYCGKPLNAPNPPHHLAAGTVLNGRYLVGSSIGEGGFGITYVGFDQTLELKIAIKEYFPSGCANRNNTLSNEVTLNLTGQNEFFKNGRESFLREAKSIAKFSNERGIVDVRDFFTQNNTAYIIMEFLEGKNLNQYILQNGVFQADKLLALMEPLMQSLEKMHNKGVIHRDISPDNIMYLDNGILKLMDFGAARYYAGEGTRSMSVVLKQGYAPYEQYSRKGNQGPWTDVYALCATIYKCITGKTPPDSLDRCMEDTLTPPSKMGIAVSPAVENALMKGLAIYPTERCQSVGELMELMKTPAAQNQPEKNQKPSLKKTEPAGIREDFKNKTVAADIPAPKDEQKTVAADVPVINQSAEKPKKKKRGKKKILIPVIAFVVLVGVLSTLIAVNPTVRKTLLPWTKNMQGDGPNIDLTDKILAAYNEGKTFGVSYSDFIKINNDATVSYYRDNEASGEYTELDLYQDLVNVAVVRFADLSIAEPYFVHTFGTVTCPELYSSERASFAEDVDKWTNIEDIAIQENKFIVGLKSDGTAVAAGDNTFGQCDVSGWSNLAAVSARMKSSVGTKNDGTLVWAGDYNEKKLKNIAPVPQPEYFYYLRKNGTVWVSQTENGSVEDEIRAWENIVQLNETSQGFYGLKSDGTVVFATYKDKTLGRFDVSDWRNIVAIHSTGEGVIGKKSDGTYVIACDDAALKKSFEEVVNN